MASITSEDFQKLIKEQQTTNVLLTQGNQDPDVGSSIKQNLGEILNARSLATRDEQYQKNEGVTEVDEKVGEVKDVNQTMLQQILNKIQGIASNQTSQSVKQSNKKGEESFLKRLFKPISNLGKDLKETFSFLTNEKGGIFDFGGFIGKTKLFALLAALPFFLNSKFFENMLYTIDELIIPAFKGINNFLKEKFTKPLNELGELLGVGELGGTIANTLLAVGGFALISSKFRKFLTGKFIPLFLSPKNNIFARIARFGSGMSEKLDKNGKKTLRNAQGQFAKKGSIFKRIIMFFPNLLKGIFKGALVALKFAGPIGLIVTAIVGVFEGLVAGIKTFLNGGTILDSLKAFGAGFVKSILSPLIFLYDLIVGFIPDSVKEKIGKVVDEIKRVFGAGVTRLTEIKDNIVGKFNAIFGEDGFFRQIGDKIDEFRSKFSINSLDIFNTIKEKTKPIVDFFQRIANFVDDFKLSDVKLPTINFDFIDDVLLFFKAIGKGAGSALKAALPGGKTPQEAFMETFEKVMDSGSQNITPTADLGSNADAMNENALNKGGEGMTTIVNNVNQNNSNDVKQDVVNNHSKQIAHNNALHTSIASSG